MDVDKSPSTPRTLTSQLVENEIAKGILKEEREEGGYEGLIAEMIENDKSVLEDMEMPDYAVRSAKSPFGMPRWLTDTGVP
jgi:hypothetical protein